MKSIAIAAVAAALLTGCASMSSPLSSHVDQHWGEAMQLNISAQIANPEAGSGQAVEGLDPVTGGQVASRYYKSQQQEQPKEVRTLLVDTE